MLLMLSSTLFAAETGKVFMGVYLEDISQNYYQKIGMKDNYGILITKVQPDTPAEEAGLLAKDVLMEIDGDKIYTHEQFTKMLKNYQPGQKVKLKFFRDGKEKTIKFTFGEKEIPQIKKKAYLGVFLRELSSSDSKKKNYDRNYGIIITDLVEDAAAQKSGIKPGAILMELDGDKIYTIDQLTKMLLNYEPENQISVKVWQDEKEISLDLILGEKAKYTPSYWNWGDYNLHLEKPENVFVYQYSADNNKWIGVMLHIVENTKNDVKEITVKIDEVIEDTPAEKAGLKAGDIILAVDGKNIDSQKMISRIINEKNEGDTVEIKIERDGKIREMKCGIALRKEHERFEKVQLSLDDGDISVWVDGEERNLKDILQDDLEGIKILGKEKLEKVIEKTKEEMEKLKESEELQKLEELEIHFGQSGAI